MCAPRSTSPIVLAGMASPGGIHPKSQTLRVWMCCAVLPCDSSTSNAGNVCPKDGTFYTFCMHGPATGGCRPSSEGVFPASSCKQQCFFRSDYIYGGWDTGVFLPLRPWNLAGCGSHPRTQGPFLHSKLIQHCAFINMMAPWSIYLVSVRAVLK